MAAREAGRLSQAGQITAPHEPYTPDLVMSLAWRVICLRWGEQDGALEAATRRVGGCIVGWLGLPRRPTPNLAMSLNSLAAFCRRWGEWNGVGGCPRAVELYREGG